MCQFIRLTDIRQLSAQVESEQPLLWRSLPGWLRVIDQHGFRYELLATTSQHQLPGANRALSHRSGMRRGRRPTSGTLGFLRDRRIRTGALHDYRCVPSSRVLHRRYPVAGQQRMELSSQPGKRQGRPPNEVGAAKIRLLDFCRAERPNSAVGPQGIGRLAVTATAVRACAHWWAAWASNHWPRDAQCKKPATNDAARQSARTRTAACPKCQLG